MNADSQFPTTTASLTPPDRDETRLNANGHDTPRPGDIQSDGSEALNQTFARPSVSSDDNFISVSAKPRTDATERDEARPDTTERVEPRPVADERDVARTDAMGRGETFASEQEKIPVPEINWLDVEQAAERLKERGISRTIRTIQKMCKREDLVAKLVPTENGVRYIISDLSIDDFVERHNQKLPSGGFSSAPQVGEQRFDVVSGPSDVAPEMPSPNDVERSSTNTHFREIIDLKNEQIAMLQSQVQTANAQISVKDEQIATMHERDHETNILIQNLQGLIALPQARSDTQPGTSAIDIDNRANPSNSHP